MKVISIIGDAGQALQVICNQVSERGDLTGHWPADSILSYPGKSESQPQKNQNNQKSNKYTPASRAVLLGLGKRNARNTSKIKMDDSNKVDFGLIKS